ncbi:STICHEL-like protein [Drosera capensis]
MSGRTSIRVCGDPSKMQLKKELTQIRKAAARALRDPGTTSTWKSPLSSSATRSTKLCPSFQDQELVDYDDGTIRVNKYHYDDDSPNTGSRRTRAKMEKESSGNGSVREREKGVFLYNWRSRMNNRSSSEKSLGRIHGDFDHDGRSIGGDASASSGSSSSGGFDGNMSDARNGGRDSKRNGYLGNDRSRGGTHCYLGVFKCRDTRLRSSLALPVVTRPGLSRKLSKKVGSCNLKNKRKSRTLERVITGKSSKKLESGLKGMSSTSLVFGQDESLGLIEQLDGRNGSNSEDFLLQDSDASPLLNRARHKKLYSSSGKYLQGSVGEDSSCSRSTPTLSTSSYNRYLHRKNPSFIRSWDGATASSLEMEDEPDDLLELPLRQGCGLPCYWPKRSTKHKGVCGSCCSPSIASTFGKQGSRILCGSLNVSDNHSYPDKEMVVSSADQGHAPLLNDPCGGRGSSLGTRSSDDETSMSLEELNLEGLSSLDGRRWSSICNSREKFEGTTLGGKGDVDNLSEKHRSLSQRYRPIFFDELLGQHVVVQSLMNSVTKGRVAPMYLFHGPRGTGKTSSAKIFATALNCLANEGTKPCGICKQCTEFISGKSNDIIEVDGTSKKEIEGVHNILKSISATTPSAFTGFKTFVIDECHLLPSKAWLAFLKFLDEPLPRVVFILITTTVENVPRTVLSRCQKYVFNKIKDDDIFSRLQKISMEENLDVDPDALELIAQNADGSIRDAETMLDQLTLLGKRITTSLVNELVGLVSDEKLLELLESAMASNTAETVKRARELLDSGLDPLALMSQLASLIMDIIAGNYPLSGAQSNNPGRSLNDTEIEKLKHALKLLSEAEKQLRVSSERSTWFTATLLQLGSVTSPEFTLTGSSRRLSSRTSEEAPSTASRGAIQSEKFDAQQVMSTDISSLAKVDQLNATSSHLDTLDELWLLCIERCHSRTLRQLLLTHGKLVSLSKVDGMLVAYIAFGDVDIKSRAEGFLNSITSSMEMILRRNVVVKMVSLPNGSDTGSDPIGSFRSDGRNQLNPASAIVKEDIVCSCNIVDSRSDSHQHLNQSNKGLNGTQSELVGSQEVNRNSKTEERKGSPMQRMESLVCQERPETAWMQAAEKGTPRSGNHRRPPEKNQVLPQDSIYGRRQPKSLSSIDSYHQDDTLNNEIKILKVDKKAIEMDLTGKRPDGHCISPSLLHQKGFSGNLAKEHYGYESGTGARGCNMWFCWNTKNRRSGKVVQGSPVLQKGRRFLCFGECKKKYRQKAKLKNK